ncbi:MAG: GatB/YqeY domain-containing protein [Wenzhouxiangella sp.]
MSIKQQLSDDIKQAMRGGDKPRLKTLRMVSAAIKQREVDERIELDDSAVLAVLEKMIKQRRESAEQYHQGQRPELAEIEEAEIAVLAVYLPEPLGSDELDALIDEAIAQQDASGMAAMGAVMASLKEQVQGRADMREVSARVRTRLAG